MESMFDKVDELEISADYTQAYYSYLSSLQEWYWTSIHLTISTEHHLKETFKDMENYRVERNTNITNAMTTKYLYYIARIVA